MDTKSGTLVKGVHFRDIREVGDPAEFAGRYEDQGADELVFLDIEATPEGKPTYIEAIRRVSDRISIPLTVGGGIRSVEDVKAVFQAGAAKVSIGTAGVKNPNLLTEISDKFGKEKVVSAIDADKISEDKWEVHVSGGRKPTGTDLIEWAKEVETRGVGEILYTGVHTDGTQEGYDLEGTRSIVEIVDIPVIASGGAGKLEHIYEALTTGKADAALAASIFHYGTYTVKEVKEYLQKRGVPVRI